MLVSGVVDAMPCIESKKKGEVCEAFADESSFDSIDSSEECNFDFNFDFGLDFRLDHKFEFKR
jgi:hypothetical protein